MENDLLLVTETVSAGDGGKMVFAFVVERSGLVLGQRGMIRNGTPGLAFDDRPTLEFARLEGETEVAGWFELVVFRLFLCFGLVIVNFLTQCHQR